MCSLNHKLWYIKHTRCHSLHTLVFCVPLIDSKPLLVFSFLMKLSQGIVLMITFYLKTPGCFLYCIINWLLSWNALNVISKKKKDAPSTKWSCIYWSFHLHVFFTNFLHGYLLNNIILPWCDLSVHKTDLGLMFTGTRNFDNWVLLYWTILFDFLLFFPSFILVYFTPLQEESLFTNS